MKTLITVSNTLITAILEGAPVSEPAKQQLMKEVGLTHEKIADITARTSIVTLFRLWKRIVQCTHPHVGLDIGRASRGDRFGLAVHAAQNSSDFRQGLQRLASYSTLINDMMQCSVDETPHAIRFRIEFPWDLLDLERHAVDITFAGLVRWGRERFGQDFAPQTVYLKHSLREAEPLYREALGAPIVFGAGKNELVFDSAIVNQPIPSANRELGVLLERYASIEVSKIPTLTSLPARVAQLIRQELEEGRTIELSKVCNELGFTSRQLQRKLGEADTSFSILLDDARKAWAPSLLVDPKLNVEQVGYRLGYSEPTAFIRAFKKWYGVTPGEYRRRNQK